MEKEGGGGGVKRDISRALQNSESVFLDEGQGASGGVSYFAIFFINLDQWEERISDVAPFHW